VYDVTSFLDSHPGGREVLMLNLGTNADTRFEATDHPPR
jgi:cytochrome b involved in lipid metabolism